MEIGNTCPVQIVDDTYGGRPHYTTHRPVPHKFPAIPGKSTTDAIITFTHVGEEQVGLRLMLCQRCGGAYGEIDDS